MTRTFAFITATLIATSASAGQSDRYHDLRLDTANPQATQNAERDTATNTLFGVPVISTMNKNEMPKPSDKGYQGVGPYNDSR